MMDEWEGLIKRCMDNQSSNDR